MKRWTYSFVAIVATATMLLLVATAAAVAQTSTTTYRNVCTGQPASAASLVDYAASNASRGCLNATSRTLRANAAGVVAWRYCQDPATGKYGPQFVVGAWAEAASAPGMVVELAAAGLSMDEAAVQALAAKYINRPISDPLYTPVWCPFWDEMRAGIPAPPSAKPWTVARFSVQPTRPAFPVVNGARGTVSTGRAPVGAACDCSKPLTEPGATFCPFAGGGALVAQCTPP